MEAGALQAEILEAFKDVYRISDRELFYGSQDNLWVERYIGRDDEWQDIPGDIICGESSALTDCTPEGFQYLLPAYMYWVLENSESTSNSTDYTIYALDVPKGEKNSQKFRLEKFEKLSSLQKATVYKFLKWAVMSEELDFEVAQHAIDAYWGELKIENT